MVGDWDDGLWYALDERVTGESISAGACRRVVSASTDGAQSTDTAQFTRVDTLVVEASLVRRAIGVGEALGAAAGLRIAEEVRQT